MFSSFAVRDHPVQIVRVVKDHIGSAVVVINALFVEEGVVGCFDTQNFVDVGIAPTGVFIGFVEIFVGRAGLGAAVILVALGHVDIDRHAVLRNGRIVAVPLGSAVEIGRIQARTHGHRAGHGFAACGIPGGIDPAGIHGKILDEVFRQLNGLPGRFFAPVRELRRNHDHLRVQLCPCGEAAPVQIAAGRIFAKPHHAIARHAHHHRELAAAVVALRQIVAVMDVAVGAGENLLRKQACLNRLGCGCR